MFAAKNTFLSWGPEKPPSIEFLDDDRVAFLYQRLEVSRTADGQRRAFALVFGNGTETAVACHREFMPALLEYRGQYADLIHATASVILAHGINGLFRDDGGQPAEIAPPVPQTPRPGGEARELIFGGDKAVSRSR